ncbi:MAG: DUF3040 domain-containing protein [Actinobacteria bacterium]|nr:DUF3040 domain-containing protein [Actinomycetota bacterium]
MALSEQEQRLLDQMEAALAAEDPKLASTLRGTTHRWQRRRAVLAGFGFLVGLAGLIGGMQVHPAVSVIGFVVMLAASVLGVAAWQQSGASGDGQGAGRAGGHSEFMGRMEERWRRNQDDSSL